jgi:hypothetical protein
LEPVNSTRTSPATTATTPHFALFAKTFSPNDANYDSFNIYLEQISGDFSRSKYLGMTDVQVHPDMGNPSQLVSRFLAQVEQKLITSHPSNINGLPKAGHAADQPIEITIYLNGHGRDGIIEYWDPNERRLRDLPYEELWTAIDNHTHRIELNTRTKPTVNIIIDSCFSGSISKSLQRHQWQSLRTRFNILNSSNESEHSYSSGLHSALDLAQIVNRSLSETMRPQEVHQNGSVMEQAMATASQLQVSLNHRGQIKVFSPNFYTIYNGQTFLKQFTAKKYLLMLNEVTRIQDEKNGNSKFFDGPFHVSPGSLVRGLANLLPPTHPLAALYTPDYEYTRINLPTNIIELDSAEKMWLHWKIKLMSEWEPSELYSNTNALSWFAVQPETKSQATQIQDDRIDAKYRTLQNVANDQAISEISRDRAIEIVYETAHLLNSGRTTEAILNIQRINELLSDWPNRASYSMDINLIETGFINTWSSAINEGKFRLNNAEIGALKSIGRANQVWFKSQLNKRLDPTIEVQKNRPIGYSRVFNTLVKINANKADALARFSPNPLRAHAPISSTPSIPSLATTRASRVTCEGLFGNLSH